MSHWSCQTVPQWRLRATRTTSSQFEDISRELALLEKVRGWHALPNGIVVHSSPQATHFLDPSLSFGDEWCARMTLLKKKGNSGLRDHCHSGQFQEDLDLR